MSFFNLKLKYWLPFILSFPFFALFAQDSTNQFFDKTTKRYTLYTAGVYGVSMIGLNQLWYKDYPQSKFHLFNDNNEWYQIDKVGHIYSTYVLSRFSNEMLRGIENKNKRLLLAGGSSFIFLTTIEIFDGYSKEWGFSIGDVLANTTGIALYTLQEAFLEKQFLKLKYSYHNTKYQKIRPSVLGENTLQGAFKDYNGQTYWASINLNNISKVIKPNWLSISFGYGAEGMIVANTKSTSKLNEQPYRQYYLSLDVDFEKIKTNNKFLKTIFIVMDHIKVPLPAIEFNEGNKTKFYGIYF